MASTNKTITAALTGLLMLVLPLFATAAPYVSMWPASAGVAFAVPETDTEPTGACTNPVRGALIVRYGSSLYLCAEGVWTAVSGGTEITSFEDLQSAVADAVVLKAGTLTDAKLCAWDAVASAIVCDTAASSGVTNLAYDNATRIISSDTGTDAALPEVVAGGISGLMTGTDKTKLDGIETGAEINNISDTDATDLTDAGDSTLHYHAADRVWSSMTGVPAGFADDVDNDTIFVPNTSPTADHAGFDDETDARIALHTAVTDAHHSRYTDAEAVTAMGTKDDANPLHHDRTVDTDTTCNDAGVDCLFAGSAIEGGTATTALALSADPDNCPAGSYPLGISDNGTAQSCTDATGEIDSAIGTHVAIAAAHHTKTTSFAELTDNATDEQIPNDITIDLASAVTSITDHLEDTPTDNETDKAPTSNALFDHEADLALHVTNGDSHDHVGGDGAQIDHTGLSNIGSNSHSDIDTHLGSSSNPHTITLEQARAAGNALTGDINTTGGIELINNSGANRSAEISNNSVFDGLPTFVFYPTSAGDAAMSFLVSPKGAGLSFTKSQFVVFNNDRVANPTNYQGLVVRATGVRYDITQTFVGSSVALPILLSASSGGALKQLYLPIDGTVGVNTTTTTGTLQIKALSDTTPGLGITLAATPSAHALSIDSSTATPGDGDIFRVEADGDVVATGGIQPGKFTADPCATLSEGSAFYNDTSDYFCFCTGAGADVQMHSPGTACF
jgi:hypothetical protein